MFVLIDGVVARVDSDRCPRVLGGVQALTSTNMPVRVSEGA